MFSLNTRRPTIAEINLNNLAYNYRSSRSFIGTAVKYMAVVKADAYGHGAVECSRRLASEGIDWLGVALVEEALELRNAGIRTPVLCLGSFWPGQESVLIENDVTPVVYQLDRAERLNSAAAIIGRPIRIHVKIDTGMGRLGVRFDEVEDFVGRLRTLDRLRVDGLMTHFAVADELGGIAFTDLQIKRFYDSVEMFKNAGFDPTHIDLANSPGAVVHPASRGNMVRLGGILYGLGGDILPSGIAKPALKPVLSLRSRIAQLKRVPAGDRVGYGHLFTTKRDSLIAAVPIGYHDGYRRGLSNNAKVIVNGTFAPVVGRVSMDWITIDVTDVPGAAEEDVVILIGEQNGVSCKAEDLAAMVDTISYEITCGIGSRVERRFTGVDQD